ncbi:MAG TPA: tetratricopeptide repeat protein, partial [Thermoanaerobaculia bacterium]|nr:tetratricopeptide repeat protein [Thermoanaerobaculia bacterium]
QEYNAGNTGQALALFTQALASDATFAKAHYMLAMCHVGRGENAAAKEQFEKFLAMAPDDPDAATAREMLSYLK